MKLAFIQLKLECSLGSMHIASMVKGEATTRVFISEHERDIAESVVQYHPDILAYSTFTGECDQLLAINNEIKKHVKALSVFGGPHPTYNPDFIDNIGVDVICRGEGEHAMLDLIKALKNGEDYVRIKNLYCKGDNGEIHKNTIRELVNNIDELPFPDREIYSHYFHLLGFKENVVKRVITGRGCPYNCSYCYNHALKKIYKNKGTYLRVRSVDNLIEELKILIRIYHISDFDFVDDIFGIIPKWRDEFGEKYIEQVNIPFSCLSRIEIIDDQYAASLKKMGCRLVNIGIESGNEHYRKEILRRKYSNEEVRKKTELLHRHGISFSTLNIILLPAEKLKMALETLRLNITCRPFDAWIAIYQPYPGTELADYAINNDFIDEETKTIPENLFKDSLLKNPQKKAMMRLFYLFSFTVKFSYFYYLTRILIHLPLDRVYQKTYNLYKNEIRKRYLLNLSKVTGKMTLTGFFRKMFSHHSKEENVILIQHSSNNWKNGKK